MQSVDGLKKVGKSNVFLTLNNLGPWSSDQGSNQLGFKMKVNSKLADRIANRVYKSKWAKLGLTDWSYLRDCCEHSDLDPFQLDMLTDMVMSRLEKLMGDQCGREFIGPDAPAV